VELIPRHPRASFSPAEPDASPTRAAPPRVVILSDSRAIDRRGRLIDITGLVAVRTIRQTRSWIVPIDSVEGGNEPVLLDLGDGCDSGGCGGGDGPQGGGGERMFAGMQTLMFEGDTIDCCEAEYEVLIEKVPTGLSRPTGRTRKLCRTGGAAVPGGGPESVQDQETRNLSFESRPAWRAGSVLMATPSSGPYVERT